MTANRKWKLYLYILLSIGASVLVMSCSKAQTKQQASPAGLRKIPPAIYQFQSYGRPEEDFQRWHPEYGPIGGVSLAVWADINPEPGKYNWGVYDKYINAEAQYTVTLRSGEVISKPVIIQVVLSLAYNTQWSCSGVYYFDGTPGWVLQRVEGETGKPSATVCGRKVGHVITGCGAKAVIPAYDSSAWRSAVLEMVKAMGQHYANNPQVVAILIASGLDGETQITKEGGCNWATLLDQQAPGVNYRFQQFLPQLMLAYRNAFPNTPVFIQNTPGGSGVRAETSRYAASIGVGIHGNGGWSDAENWKGYGGEMGIMDPFAIYAGQTLMGIESKSGLGNREEKYWGWLAWLHFHPDEVDSHPEWIRTSDPSWLAFVQDHLGVTAQTTPDVWIALRDLEYPVNMWGANGQSGWPGDFQFFLTRSEPAGSKTVRVWRKDMPASCTDQVESRQARRTDSATGNRWMAFTIDPAYMARFSKFAIEVTYIDQGLDTFTIANQTIRKTGTGRFVSATVYSEAMPNPFYLDCLDGDEVVHKVLVRGYTDTPPSTAVPAPTQTIQPSATPKPTGTAVPPTYTPTVIPTPTSTKTPVPTATPAPTMTPIPVATIAAMPTALPMAIQEQIRAAAANAANVFYNPNTALIQFARVKGLGIATSGEWDFALEGTAYRGQCFANGIAWCPIGRWDECQVCTW